MLKVGDKFIIEIGERYETTAASESVFGEKRFDAPDNLYRIKGFDSLVFDEHGLDKLEKFDRDRWLDKDNDDLDLLTEQEVNDTFDDGYKDGYGKGLNDAWEVARKLIDNPAFDGLTAHEILNQFSPSDAIEKIRQYEEKQKKEEFKVGDEVHILNCNDPYIVTSVDSHGYISVKRVKNDEGRNH